MQTELELEKSEIKKVENGIRFCEEVIAKAEKYERLNDNKDWKGFLEDLKILMGLHDNEIKMACVTMVDAPTIAYVKKDGEKEVVVSSRTDWADFIVRHEIQRAQIVTWIKEPERVIGAAALARERIVILNKRLNELMAVQAPQNGGKGAKS